MGITVRRVPHSGHHTGTRARPVISHPPFAFESSSRATERANRAPKHQPNTQHTRATRTSQRPPYRDSGKAGHEPTLRLREFEQSQRESKQSTKAPTKPPTHPCDADLTAATIQGLGQG